MGLPNNISILWLEKEILMTGHASIVLTLETYSHVLPSLQKDAADKMELLLFATA